MGKANHENNENWIPTNKKYFTVVPQPIRLNVLWCISLRHLSLVCHGLTAIGSAIPKTLLCILSICPGSNEVHIRQNTIFNNIIYASHILVMIVEVNGSQFARFSLAWLQSSSGLWIDDVRLSTFWLTSAFKFVLDHIKQYRLYTLHGNRPWWDLLNCHLSLWPWPWLFLFKVTS